MSTEKVAQMPQCSSLNLLQANSRAQGSSLAGGSSLGQGS